MAIVPVNKKAEAASARGVLRVLSNVLQHELVVPLILEALGNADGGEPGWQRLVVQALVRVVLVLAWHLWERRRARGSNRRPTVEAN